MIKKTINRVDLILVSALGPNTSFLGTFIRLGGLLGQRLGLGLGLGPGLDNNHQSHFIHVLPPFYEVESKICHKTS